MRYKVTNIIGTSRYPTRRAAQKHHKLRKGTLCIGARTLSPAQSITISKATYDANQKTIKEFESLGALKVAPLVGPLDGADLEAALGKAAPEPAPAPAPKAEEKEAAPAPAPEEEKAVEEMEEPPALPTAKDSAAPAKRRGRAKKGK